MSSFSYFPLTVCFVLLVVLFSLNVILKSSTNESLEAAKNDQQQQRRLQVRGDNTPTLSLKNDATGTVHDTIAQPNYDAIHQDHHVTRQLASAKKVDICLQTPRKEDPKVIQSWFDFDFSNFPEIASKKGKVYYSIFGMSSILCSLLYY